jgi:putative transposase
VKSNNTLMPRSFMRTLRLKIRREAYGWLNAAAVEVNEVFNYCNEISLKTATRTDIKRKWLTGFDLCNLTAGASPYFDRIGAGTIQSICTHYAQKRQVAKRVKLRWRVSRGPKRSLGWIPFKAANLKRKGVSLRFAGKCFRVFEKERLEGVKWQEGCFAQDAVPSEGERLVAGRWTHRFAPKLASAQRRGYKRQAKRIHRKAARCRADALHKFSSSMVDRYQNIIVGDVSSSKLVKTRMAKSVLDSGWGMLKRLLEYKSQQAARGFEVVSERNSSVTCSACGALTGPRGVNGLIVRSWVCCGCGESHDRDVNAARNILIGSRCRTSASGNEQSSWLIPPSRVYRVREAETVWAAA